jgi:hypothetical protein
MSIDVNVQNDLVIVTESSEDITVNVSNAAGPAGVGVPVGGTTGQVLKKLSNTNYDTYWALDGGGVPYSGATGDVNLGEYGLSAGQLTLDTTPTGTAVVGTTRWNDAIGSSETTLKGGNVILKNGVDLVARVVNKVSPNTTLTKAAYQAVRVSGAQGQRLAVALAQANNDANSADTIGLVIETIATNQEGFIMTVGQLENINTTGSLQGETWADGDVLYLSPTTAGRITKVKPTGNGHIVVIGYVEYAHANNGKIYVKVMNGWELDELHNVAISSPANNDALIYESSTSLWKNKTIATALGYTPQAALTLTTTGTSGAATLVGATLNIPQYSGGGGGNTIYSGDGTLAGDRTITSNGNSLTILGGKEITATEQTALTLQTSATNKATIELVLNNTYTSTGKSWRFRSLNTGAFDIATGISRSFYIGSDGNVVIKGGSSISGAEFSVSGSIASSGGLQVQGGLGSPTGAGIEIEYNGGISYFTSFNRSTSSWLPIIIRGSQIDLTTAGSTRARLTNAGRLLLGTTTDPGYQLFTTSGGVAGYFQGGTGGYAAVAFSGDNNATIGALTTYANQVIIGRANNTYGNQFGANFDILIQSNGDVSVGSGVARPYKFHVNGSADVTTLNIARTSAQLLYSTISGLAIVGTTGSSYNMALLETTGNKGLFIDASGFVKVGVYTDTFNSSAILEAVSTTKGFLPPRMTTTQKNAISSPAAGLVVYDTDTNKLCCYNGSTWNDLF